MVTGDSAATQVKKDFSKNSTLQPLVGTESVSVNEKTILIVEDDRFSRTLLSNIVRDNFKNFRILTGKNFQESKAILMETSPIDLIILDIFLDSPETGVDLLKLLEENFISPPKVLISSVLEKGRVNQMIKGLELDLSYIMKPAHPESYVYAIESLLGGNH